MRCALLLFTGCYVAGRSGVTAPVGHGHGGGGADLMFDGGGEYRNSRVRAGGGVEVGVRFGVGNDYLALAAAGHVAVALTGWELSPGRLLLVAHGAIGGGLGFAQEGQPTPPSGLLLQGFLGLGLGATYDHRDINVYPSHAAIGLSANRLELSGGSSFWFLGVALEGSYGFDGP